MKTSPKFWLALIAVAAVVACIAFFFMAAGPDQPLKKSAAHVTDKTSLPSPSSTPNAARSPAQLPVQPRTESTSPLTAKIPSAEEIKSQAASASTVTKDQIVAEINHLAISYSATELPKIQPYLSHPDPEIRAAAFEGIMTVSDAAGAPILREAAKRAATPQEAAKLLESADYLELPSGTLLRKKAQP